MPVSRVGGPCPDKVSPHLYLYSVLVVVLVLLPPPPGVASCVYIYIYVCVCVHIWDRMKTMFEIQSTSICGFRLELRIPFSQSYYTRPHDLMHERVVGSWRIKQSDGEVLRRKNNMNVVHDVYIYIYMNINRF